MTDRAALNVLSEERGTQIVGVFAGPWDTGWSARDGAVLGFEDVFRAFSAAAQAGELELVTADIEIFRDHRRIRDFLVNCDAVYANCGPWAALLYLVREREQLDVRIIREVRTIGWVGYIWQEEVVAQLARPGDQRVFPSRYARDIWDDAMPCVSHSRVYYPLIHRTSRHTTREPRTGGTAGFFSVLSRDKGFACLPRVISRMLAGGHPINRLVLAGEQTDQSLYESVVNALSDIGVEVIFRGGLPNTEVRELMAGCDCIFFLSVSSIESLGRVMIEASEQGVPVIAADFGAARDLVHKDYRIPIKYMAEASGPCDSAFPLAQLDVQHWEPPANLSLDTCFLHTVGGYMSDAQKAADILHPPLAELPAAPRPLAFSFKCSVDGLELAHRLLDEPDVLGTAPRHELLDLGGSLKQFLLSSGYNPRISFLSDSETQAHTNDTRSGAWSNSQSLVESSS